MATQTWRDSLTAHFPDACPLADARRWLREQLDRRYGADRSTILLGTSACSDDILASKDMSRDFWGPFTLGGLGGLPHCGRTAMQAFAHHVPDNGTALLIYGPHVGLTRDGVWGWMRRPGQTCDTKSCGALMAAVARMEQRKELEELEPDTSWPGGDDQQQVFLERVLWPFRARILAAEFPATEVTKVAYSLVHRQVQHLMDLARDEFRGARIVYVGAVVINTGPDEEDWLEIRDHGVIETGDKVGP